MKWVYIAGPITGIPRLNAPAFEAAKIAWENAGWAVINPLDLDQTEEERRSEKPHSWYMKRDLPHLLRCDAVALLPHWQESRGACIEQQVAQWCGIPQYDALHPVSVK